MNGDEPDTQSIFSGSSAFDLANSINEPLTGRKLEYRLYHLSIKEMVLHHGRLEESRLLSYRLIYGYYPDVITARGNEKEILHQLSDSYLFKDILMWERIKKPDKLVKLLQALAFQIRNVLIANFALPELRQDIGALWENFLLSERMKYLHYHRIRTNCYFWRTQDQQEIDYIEERDGMLHDFEFKWNPAKKARLSQHFPEPIPITVSRLLTGIITMSF